MGLCPVLLRRVSPILRRRRRVGDGSIHQVHQSALIFAVYVFSARLSPLPAREGQREGRS